MYDQQLSQFYRQDVINHVIRLTGQASVINSSNRQEIHARLSNLWFVDLNKALRSRDESPDTTTTQLVAH